MSITIYGDIHIHESKTTTNQSIRSTPEMKTVKNAVKERDKICQCCGKTDGGHLEAHHIFPLAKYPELATDEGNLISLCQKCHRTYHETYKGSENPTTLVKFINDYVGSY